MTEGRCKDIAEAVESDYGFAIPWQLIQQLVEWVIENCFNRAESLADAAANPSVFQMFVLRRQVAKRLRREGYRGLKLQRATNAVTNQVLVEAGNMSAADVEIVFGEYQRR